MNRIYTHLLALLGLATLAQRGAAQGIFSYDYKVLPIPGINTPANDYAPSLSADRSTIFFTSYRKESSIGEADIFFARALNGEFTGSVNPGSPLNTPGNEGALSIAADGRTVVFAADNYPGGFGDADLYIGELDGGRVTHVRNLGGRVNTKYWDSQPAISGDGHRIYFSSNRKGGIGGTDIWVTEATDAGEWSAPANLGPMINTKRNERSPYITPDGGTLYMSSNGIAGFGGYDIFIATRDGADWTQPANLGSLINSDGDELFFFAPSKTQRFYYASTRRGGEGGLDLYYGTPNVFGEGICRLAVRVLDSATRSPLPSAISVVDVEAGDTVATILTNAREEEYDQMLPAGRAYRVVARVRGQKERVAEIAPIGAGESGNAELLYGSIMIAEFNLGRYNIPFFVTGYYRPNTTRNLEELLPLLKGPLGEAGYIERFAKGTRRYQRYSAYAGTIDSILANVRDVSVGEIFPRFASEALPGEILEITITGYADPQPFVGSYVEEEPVAFEERGGARHELRQGESIGNLELSGLRAWYSGHELERIFADAAAGGHPEYLKLRDAGRIRLRYVGGGVSLDASDYAAQRRIHIAITRTGGNGSGRTEYDFSGAGM
jgi:hypothetical protein